jgi:tetratricopeptide (TPR) repeat protein
VNRYLHRSLLAAAALLPCALLGCDMAPPQTTVGAADLTRPLVPVLEVSTNTGSPDPGQELPPEQEARLTEFNELLDKFLGRGPEIFDTDETDRHLNGIEEMASLTDRSFELINLYRKVYDDKGAGHYVAPRLAWAYLNLGQIALARQVVDASTKARPKDARNYFIHGYLLGREQEMNAQSLRLVYAAWAKALELDPALKGLYGVRAEVIRDRLKQMERLLESQPAAAPSSAPAAAPSAGATSAPAALADGGPGLEESVAQGKAALADGEHQRAFASFTRALSMDPNHAAARYGQAIAGWKAIGAQDPARGKALLRKVAATPDQLDARQLYELGTLMLREAKDPNMGLLLLRRVANSNPELVSQEELARWSKEAQENQKP